ncbi:Uncharacterized protein OBRU01_13911 [Operophtera brumata]|uniref:Saposin n=1 Tax=Operophtera brumata TaxID=104452 RepID=A0A0L7L7M7_OPEBR|nr:Uncharacterized protein OBRU01_13911 [Operophtera brumata]
MANTLGVCLLAVLCCANLSFARQLPKECSKGPTYWCQSLSLSAQCHLVNPSTNAASRATRMSGLLTIIAFPSITEKIPFCFSLLEKDGDNIARFCNPVLSRTISLRGGGGTYWADLWSVIGSLVLARTSITHLTECSVTRIAADCGAVAHCSSTVWETREQKVINHNDVSDKFIRLFGELKDVNDMINEEYLGARIESACHDVPFAPIAKQCKDNTAGLQQYVQHVLKSKASAQTMCAIIGIFWPKQSYPQDNDSICKICTDMVTQARDQLLSNETQLIPLKIVRSECIKLVDDFVPELVETLSSEMNPQAVCSVAGLCNNAKIDQMLIGYNAQLALREGCNNCSRTVSALRKRFDATSYEDFLVRLLQSWRALSECLQYCENIVEAAKDLTPHSVCHVTGQCAYKYHQHDEYDFPEDTADECLHLAEQYYPLIYEFLTKGLNPAETPTVRVIAPTPPSDVAGVLPIERMFVGQPQNKVACSFCEYFLHYLQVELSDTNTISGELILLRRSRVLPIERMFVAQPQNKAVCSYCEYFLHYLQVELSDTNTIERVTAAVDTACDKLPSSVNAECKQFVDEYGPSVVALLVQEIDPASLPSSVNAECKQFVDEYGPSVVALLVQEIDPASVSYTYTACDKLPSAVNAECKQFVDEYGPCPLCLFAVEQLKAMLKDDRSEESIRKALDSLCTHLSTKLQTSCVNFVDSYSQQLVEMFLLFLIVETNEIPDNTVNGHPVSAPRAPPKTVCVVCEFVMKELDEQIKDKHNDHMPKSVRGECDQFVQKYGELVISLLAQELEPAKICEELKLCPKDGGITAMKGTQTVP